MKHKKHIDPIAQLMQEHVELLTELKKLSRAVASISRDGYSVRAFRELTVVLKVMEVEVTVHNRKEEDVLFPLIEEYVSGPTRILRNDHKKLREGFMRLLKAAKTLDRRRDSFSAIKNLSNLSQSIVRIFVNHIHKENFILFPLAQRFLSEGVLRAAAKEMLE